MANRFGASSLTALLAVAGMVGVGIAGYKAFNSSSDAAALTPVADSCPLLGDDCTMDKAARKSCCSSHKSECSDSEAKADCKNLTDGCNGDGKDGCCGGCGDKSACCDEGAATCEEKAASCSDLAATCSEKTTCCSEKATNGSEAASCSEKAAGCSEKKSCSDAAPNCTEKAASCTGEEKPKTCCSQNAG